ncbi:polysaccharide biosynthesis protein [Georgenia satyanarayanai]|uniref:polysaccharide biosynthesis protein n=1 Tax=Georgenia satyanarayanai TaxID=860221 RepID=UPI00203BCBBF|nr:nucleoside-diphosphate sugar epimerase/dehydratase [Georgenia satyanarayanai]MCM3661330.1 polysaccharide biosynthesis protein [Georgenia satyanarayanai]
MLEWRVRRVWEAKVPGGTLVRRSVVCAWDAAAWCLAVALIVGTRYEFYLSAEQWSTVFLYAALACVSQLIVGTLLKLYRGKYRLGSFEESLGLLLSTVVVALLLVVAFVALRGLDEFPRGIAFLAPPFALVTMAAGRWAYRAWQGSKRLPIEGAENVLVYGAGDAGYQLLRLVDIDSSSPFRVVGLVDDDPRKRHLSLLGRPVLGGRTDLVRAARERDVSTVILAISGAGKSLITEVADIVEGAGMKFLLLPPLKQMLGGRVKLSDVKEFEITDILGRRQVETDVASIAEYLTDRRVLVTGAGGSIGSELASQVHRFGPSRLILLDRDESALHSVQLAIYGKALLDTPDVVLASIRDARSLREAFERHRPQVVFHAAALKHLPMLEQYPAEGWKTNVWGTNNLLELAAEFGVEKFVNISTDKAANPTSILGRTKQLAERLTSWYGANAAGTYLSVRFGNVLGSRGSMLHTFQQQIARGGPITVTHPEVSRYFMTIPEACELVIQAGAIGSDGEVLVLDMGEPIRILDVAHRLIVNSGKDIDVVFTGLRPNEKLHEDLLGTGEAGVQKRHPLITHVSVLPLSPSVLESYDPQTASPLIEQTDGCPPAREAGDSID